MKILDKKDTIISVIFCSIIFLISLVVFNITSQKAIEKNIEKQLWLATKQNKELAKTKIEKVLKYKLQIFTQNLLESGNIKEDQTDYTELIKLIEYFKRENFIQIIGIVAGDEAIFIDENEERLNFDKKVIYDILLHDKSIFRDTINDKDYLIVKNTVNYNKENEVTTFYMHENNVKNNDLIIPVYTDVGYSFVVDRCGNSLFYSTIDESYVRLSNYFEDILSFSPKNLDAVNKLKLDVTNNNSGIIRYEKDGSKRLMCYIPIAEKTGFITFIDSYVFKEACIKQAEWIKKGYNIIPISVNISREKLKDQNFLYEYLKIIQEVGIEKEYVQLEITEGDIYSYDNVKSNIVDLIKDAGFTVLIDDFGVGYSSLTMLKDIHADVLKLDRSFIINESSAGKALVKYIIKIAKIFNYKIVAEGVETEEQFDFLKEDCDEIQGYYFSKPLEENEFIDKYLKWL